MEQITYISVTDICNGYKIERTYISTLQDYGLLLVERKQNDELMSSQELAKLEKIMRFQNELDINLEGIQVIMNLLEKMEALKDELNRLQKQSEILR